jgi:phospholipid/cholesterol/gamma-HCH transport system permease protein
MLQGAYHFGRYLILMGRMFVSMERPSIYWRLTMRETVMMGIGSLPIIVVSSLFMGAVTTLNTAYQLTSGYIPPTVIGTVVSTTSLMEFAPTVMCLLLAGKIGANITSEIGTMRVDEQIDALEVMGVNSASYLILPKLMASLLAIPSLVIIAGFLLHLGGIFAGAYTGEVSPGDFAAGVQEYFDPFQVRFMLTKAFSFAFLISSISCYQGYFVSGGPVEVGKASTNAVVASYFAILFANYLLSAFLL